MLMFPRQPIKNGQLFKDSVRAQQANILHSNSALAIQSPQTSTEMDHGKDHPISHNVATQHGKKSHESVDSKQHQAEENQAPRSSFQLGQTAAGYAINKAAELSTFGNTKDFEDLEAESRSNSGHDSEEQAEHTHDDDKDHHTKK